MLFHWTALTESRNVIRVYWRVTPAPLSLRSIMLLLALHTPRQHGVKFVVDGMFCPVRNENLITVIFTRHPTYPFFFFISGPTLHKISIASFKYYLKLYNCFFFKSLYIHAPGIHFRSIWLVTQNFWRCISRRPTLSFEKFSGCLIFRWRRQHCVTEPKVWKMKRTSNYITSEFFLSVANC